MNAALFAVLAGVPGRDFSGPGEIVIPVTMVEIVPEPEPPPEPEPEAEAPAEPDPVVETAESTPPTPQPSPIRSPVIAAPDETADAVISSGDNSDDSEVTLPSIGPAEEKAANALRAFQCNRLGANRPAHCDEAPKEILASLAEEPEMTPHEWEAFERPAIDPAILRIWAEDCPPKDGVINDVFTQDTTYYRQGAHAGAGSLSKNSINERCP